MKKILLLLAVSVSPALLTAQNINSISAAAGFLTISPDARGTSLGNAGAATAPDVNSQYWNPAKYVFTENKAEIALNYAPWSTKLNDGSFNAYLAGYYKLDANQSVSGSLRFYSYGDNIALVDDNNLPIGNHTPNEMALDIAYTRRLGEYLSASASFRYIQSSITKSVSDYKTGRAVAADLAIFYGRPVRIFKEDFKLGLGANISNVGTKIAYTTHGNSSYLPMNLRVGSSLAYAINEDNALAVALDFNKLMVPSGNNASNLDKPVLSAMFSSFSDASGGFSEEVREIGTSMGLEYTYMNTLALRCGYFTQSERSGGADFFSVGAGLAYKMLMFDLAYAIPTTAKVIRGNEFRFTLRAIIK